MTLGQLIKQYRKENQLSQRQFAAICDVSNGYISMLEEGKNPKTQEPIVPSIITMKKLALAMHITIDELFAAIDEMEVSLSNDFLKNNARPITKKRLPMLGNVACGEPIFANEEHETYIEADADVHADFCLTAKGDSMINARIFDGDILFVKSQDTVDDGEIAVVLIDNEATVKRVYYDKENNIITLVPENPTHKPLRYIGEQLNQIRILGKVISGQYIVE